MFNNAAEATWDEEHLYVALVQAVHELPGDRQAIYQQLDRSILGSGSIVEQRASSINPSSFVQLPHIHIFTRWCE